MHETPELQKVKALRAMIENKTWIEKKRPPTPKEIAYFYLETISIHENRKEENRALVEKVRALKQSLSEFYGIVREGSSTVLPGWTSNPKADNWRASILSLSLVAIMEIQEELECGPDLIASSKGKPGRPRKDSIYIIVEIMKEYGCSDNQAATIVNGLVDDFTLPQKLKVTAKTIQDNRTNRKKNK